VAAVRGVLISLCPEARLVDISHDLPPHDVLAGAHVLSAAYSWFPPGAIHLAVVDPGVGGPRRGVVAAGGGHVFVGPDNGLFTLLADRGLIEEVREIDAARLGLRDASSTFHGRDLFAPVAARLARGMPVGEVGPPLPRLVRGPVVAPRREGARLQVQVLHVDRFGNLTLNLTPSDLHQALKNTGAARIELPDDAWRPTPFVRTYSEGPEGRPFFLWGSSGRLEIAADRRSAADLLGARAGAVLTLLLA
jgi:S-adenosylmethionine hydrolase